MPANPVPRTTAPWFGHTLPHRKRPRVGAVMRESRALRAVTEVAAWSAVDMMAAPLYTPPCVLEPWLPQPGLAMIHSWRGIGKTWLALALSAALASGGSVLGWQAPRPRRVLHLDGETPLHRLRGRLAAVLAGAGPDGGRLDPPPELRVVSADALCDGVLDLMTEAGQHAIAPHVAAADVIVLDSLSSLCFDVAEGGDWRPAEDWLLSLRRKGKSVIATQHSGRSGHPRGNAQKEDVLDAVIALHRPRGPGVLRNAADGARFALVFEKGREACGDALRPRAVELLIGNGAARLLDAGHVLAARACDLVRAGSSQRACAKALGVSKSAVNRLMRRANGAAPPAAQPPGEGGGGDLGQNDANH